MPPEGYVCRLCDQKGHYIKDCPESGRYDDVKKEDLRRDRKCKTFSQNLEVATNACEHA